MEILIGRKEGTGCLFVAAKVGSEWKTADVGSPRSVPDSVSRCKPEQGTAHCLMEVGDDGSMKITNLKPGNKTYVGGMAVQSKSLRPDSQVSLGKDNYPLPLDVIKEIAAHFSAPPQPQQNRQAEPKTVECDVRSLKEIYRQYEASMEDITENQQRNQRNRMLPIMLGSIGGVASGVLSIAGQSVGAFISLGVGVVSVVIYISIFSKKDTTLQDRKQAQDWLFEHYVCPNTGKFLGNKDYKILQQEDRCPHCHGKRISS